MFAAFSEQLYCAGAMEHRCPLPNGSRTAPGTCYWRAANATTPSSAPRPSDEWDPEAAGVPGYRRLDRPRARECARGKRILLLGDSTTRDTFYELAAVAGRPIWTFSPPKLDKRFDLYWPRDVWSPRAPPVTSGAYDVSGMCNGNENLKPPFACLRDLWHGRQGNGTEHAGRLSYMYLISDEAWQQRKLEELWLQSSAPSFGRKNGALDEPSGAYDAVFLQCPLWTMYKPDAYNMSMTRTKRHAVRRPPSFDVFGEGCARIISLIRNLSMTHRLAPTKLKRAGDALSPTPKNFSARRHSTRRWCPTCPQIYILGVSSLPNHPVKFPPGDEDLIVQSMHRSLGLECRNVSRTKLPSSQQNRTAENAFPVYRLHSANGFIPIDRYNVWGSRKRDGVHPFFNAHFALSQLILNHLCPAPDVLQDVRGEAVGNGAHHPKVGIEQSVHSPERMAALNQQQQHSDLSWAVLRHNVIFGEECFSPHEINFSWHPPD